MKGTSGERSEDVSNLFENSAGEALQNIINKLSNIRNLKSSSSGSLPHVYRAVQDKNNSLGHSRKGLYVHSAQFDEAETRQITREWTKSRIIWKSDLFKSWFY